MGRWAQRTIRGGGPPAGAPGPATAIIAVRKASNTIAIAEFNGTVNVADFDATKLVDTTTGGVAGAVAQFGPNTLRYTAYSVNITIGDAWSFTDTVVGIVTPESGHFF